MREVFQFSRCKLLWMVACGAVLVPNHAVDRAEASTYGEQKSFTCQAALVRWIPGKKKMQPPEFPAYQSFNNLVTDLGKAGQVNLLYLSEQSVLANNGSIFLFSYQEGRPAFSAAPTVQNSVTNATLGLNLQVRTTALTDGYTVLGFEGEMSWAPTLLDQWKGERFLLFGMRLAQVLAPGAVYQESEDDELESEGINLRALFKGKGKKKKKEEPVIVATEASFLAAEKETTVFKGQFLLQPRGVATIRIQEPKDEEDSTGYVFLLLACQ